ncbi:hypothetical protein D3C81_1929220 [compost metagenome]
MVPVFLILKVAVIILSVALELPTLYWTAKAPVPVLPPVGKALTWVECAPSPAAFTALTT